MTDLETHRSRPTVSLEAALVARMYYIDDKQKNEIAEELRLSRFKVARLLDDARSSGIVRIYVDMPAEINLPMGEKLARAFGIQRAIVVRSFDAAPDAAGALIGAAAAEYLLSILNSRELLGTSWGATLTAVVDAITSIATVDVVQLVGGASAGHIVNGGVELVRRLSEKTGGRAYPLHAPLLVRTQGMAEELRSEPSLADAIGRFGRLDAALVGVGSWGPPKSSLYNEFTPEEREDLVGHGAVADMCSLVFNADGRAIDAPALRRSIGVTEAELRRVPEVIAVAGGMQKVSAISAVLRSGILNTIITDSTVATHLLEQ
ncbi:MAG: sugar-binding transcriptional regulator [Gemmatimonadaceae bacterium]